MQTWGDPLPSGAQTSTDHLDSTGLSNNLPPKGQIQTEDTMINVAKCGVTLRGSQDWARAHVREKRRVCV